MTRANHRYFTFLIVFVTFVVVSSTNSSDLSRISYREPISGTSRISLASFDSSEVNGQAFYSRTNVSNNNNTVIEIYDIPDVVSFIVVQIHTHESNVTLSYVSENCDKSNCSLYGTNLGLVINSNGNSLATVTVWNRENATVDALIAVVAYTVNAPIPGGCNLEFDFEISPFQKLHLTEATVTLDAQPALAPPKNGKVSTCDRNPVTITTYRMYLPEREFTPETYFAGIQKMMTVRDIVENGQKILPMTSSFPIRRIFSSYPGTGSIYALIATYENYSSAYVPSATYACSPLSDPYSCRNLNTTVAQALCAIVLIIGFVITFIGHKCLGFEVLFLGAICGGIISYSILAAIGYFQTSTVLGIVMAVACLSGIGWLIMSHCTGIACVATFLSSMTLGFFVASTIYFGIADDTPLFVSDVNFWLIYLGVTLLVPIVLAVLPFSSNVVCCAILGSYCIILPIDYYAGSNLKYILINTVRRATVSGFNYAIIQPPYQSTDKCLVAFLIIIALFGISVQVGKMCCCKRQRKTTVYWDEREPVLSAPRSGRRVLVFGENERVRKSYW